MPGRTVAQRLQRFAPDAVHIATEGPLGMAARRWCLKHGLAFTTSYHTRFPEYVRLRAPVPLAVSYAWMRRFHHAAARTLVATESMRASLLEHGFRNVVLWTRGVDLDLFRPRAKRSDRWSRPLMVYVGRVAVEKNLEAFLALDRPGTKLVIGDGPARATLQGRYPDAEFIGYRHGEALATAVAEGDVFVFPSRTDTFGVVMLEAMACGLPVAAYPVEGPLDVVREGVNGALDEDLGAAVERALAVDRETCRRYAEGCSWERSVAQFHGHLVRAADGSPLAARTRAEPGDTVRAPA